MRTCTINTRKVLAVVAGFALTSLSVSSPASAADNVQLSKLDKSTTSTSFNLIVDTPGTTSAKLVVDGSYIGEDKTAPFVFSVNVTPGKHSLRVRPEVSGNTLRVDADFTAAGSVPTPTPTPTPTGTPTPSPTTPVPPVSGSIDTSAKLEVALATAKPGSVINLAAGVYTHNRGDRWIAAVNGTPAQPITLRGPRNAILASDGPSGDYGLHITGDYWRVAGITVEEASKGIVLDGSNGTVLDNIEVRNVGAEAIHFRACSSDGVLRRSFIHNTGLKSPQFGEGVYVGSANSNWGSYSCTDGRDNSERNLIEDNVFQDVTAEGADLKEGTESGTLRRNLFIHTGWSGENSADSAVDAKGNNWLIESNTVRGTLLDGFQAHSVYSGYGTGNRFIGNVVEGSIPGFGIGLYPAAANVVSCTNSAPGAAKGLVGASNKSVNCG